MFQEFNGGMCFLWCVLLLVKKIWDSRMNCDFEVELVMFLGTSCVGNIWFSSTNRSDVPK